jgi:hypothetical protein
MSEIIELLYASRAAFAPVGGGGIEPDVARILAQSRRNNPKHHVGGVLCYRDGYFFQCLEGEARDVETVYQKIAADPRHQDIKVLSRRPVPSRRFKSWSMKYAAVDSTISTLLQKHGQQRFNPYGFGDNLLGALVALLHTATDTGAAPDPRPLPDRSRDRHAAPPMLASGALAMAVAAMAVALVALYRTYV